MSRRRVTPPGGRSDLALVISDLRGGGAQRVLTSLADAWTEEGRAVSLITLAGAESDVFRPGPAVRRIALGLAGESRSRLDGFFANVRRIRALRRALGHSRAPVVVSFVGATNVLTVLASLGLGKRVVVCERNDPGRQSLGPLWGGLRRVCYPLADRVATNSRGVLGSLRAYVPEAKLAFTPNPLSLPDVDTPPRKNGPLMLAVGRLHRQKGYDVLLEALVRSGARRGGWRLKILGDGPLDEVLRGQATKLGIADLVDWMGYVPDPFPWYALADAFVMPSRHEGMPNALLEAMGMGLPAIVSDASPGPLEYVEDNVSGLVVPAEDAGSLAGAMDRLMADRELAARLGDEGRRRVLADTALPRVLATWASVLDES